MDELYEQIGRLKMELEWLKKKVCRLRLSDKRALIEPEHPALSVRRQCEVARAEPVELVLRAGGGDGGEPAADAADRRAVPARTRSTAAGRWRRG